MTDFKFKVGDYLLTYDGFPVEVVDRNKDEDTGKKYYTCKAMEFGSIDREIDEDRLEKTVDFEETEGYYDPSPFIGNCWRYPIYMLKGDERLFVIRRCEPEHSASAEYDRKRILAHLVKTKGAYARFHSFYETPFELLAAVCERKHTFEKSSLGLFRENDDSVDFSGNLREVSAAFQYRIYDKDILDRIRAIVDLIQKKKYDEAERLLKNTP